MDNNDRKQGKMSLKQAFNFTSKGVLAPVCAHLTRFIYGRWISYNGFGISFILEMQKVLILPRPKFEFSEISSKVRDSRQTKF
jgi:hypothetical protein